MWNNGSSYFCTKFDLHIHHAFQKPSVKDYDFKFKTHDEQPILKDLKVEA